MSDNGTCFRVTLKNRNMIIAIDGFSSSGKSTLAKAVAKRLNITYVDTGAMYRAVALWIIRNAPKAVVESLDQEWISEHLSQIKVSFLPTLDGQHVCLNGEDVESSVRTLEVGNMASQVSTIGSVRYFLVGQQRAMGENTSLIMDGRDIGTVVFPNADIKIYLTATPEIRARRRFNELLEKGQSPNFEDVKKDLDDRDYRDTHRSESPLRKADDAIVLDNSNMPPIDQQNFIVGLVKNRS